MVEGVGVEVTVRVLQAGELIFISLLKWSNVLASKEALFLVPCGRLVELRRHHRVDVAHILLRNLVL